MWLGPFLKRELIVSVRTSRAFSDRRNTALLAAATVLGCFVLWDQRGWDRASVVGGQRFGLTTFIVTVAGLMFLALGILVPQVASAIASERDRKSLDALLSSRFSAAEILLGAMGAGLFRYANALLGAVPVVVLLVFLGGVAPIWVILAGVALASMAILNAAFAAVASVGARTGARAVNIATGLFVTWTGLPSLLALLRPWFWPGCPRWLTSTLIAMGDAGPLGLMTNLGGILPRPGGPVEAIFRMATWQVSGTLVMVVWAIARLRPASRGLYDVEGQASRLKRIKAAMRRPPGRPPCFDDPVLWNEIYGSRRTGLIWRLVNRAIGLAWLGGFVLGIWWFARPAFEELMERGYGPSPEAFSMPEFSPFLRLLINKLFSNLYVPVNPGQARLEFNIALRQFTSLMTMAFTAAVFTGAFESIKRERRRDTWLGLIVTPLSGGEILRGKTLGTLWKSRGVVITLVALWTLGLLTGAVHPLGFVAAFVVLAASGAFFSAQGLSMALAECDPEKQGRAALVAAWLPVVFMASIILVVGPITLVWASLLSYEDFVAAIRSGPFPAFGELAIGRWMGARAVVAVWLFGTSALAVGAFWMTRANARWFDAAVGRPMWVGGSEGAGDPLAAGN